MHQCFIRFPVFAGLTEFPIIFRGNSIRVFPRNTQSWQSLPQIIGLRTWCSCDCDLLVANNILYGAWCHCCNPTMWTLTLNPIQPISCDEGITVVIVPCEHTLTSTCITFLDRMIKRLLTWYHWDCDFFIATNGFYSIQCRFSQGAITTMTQNHIQSITCDKQIAVAVALCEYALDL